MAAPVVQSHTNSGWLSNTSPAPSKPTGLAVGDLLVAYVCSFIDAESTVTSPSTPSGWTNFLGYSNPGNPGGQLRLFGFSKIADSGDVAASTFTFTCDTSGSVNIAFLARVTGHTASAPIGGSIAAEMDNVGGADSTPVVTDDLHTFADDCLLFMLWAGRDANLGESNLFSSYAVSGTNPTWTEVLDEGTSIGNDGILAIAWAVIPTARTITSFTATSTVGISDYAGALVAIPPQTDIDETPTSTALSIDQSAPSFIADVSVTAASVAIRAQQSAPTVRDNSNPWSNTDKSSTISPTNLDKS